MLLLFARTPLLQGFDGCKHPVNTVRTKSQNVDSQIARMKNGLRLRGFSGTRQAVETFVRPVQSLFFRINRSQTMARAIWKGAISFGLVHIPVALVSATTSTSVDFDWLDKRSMDPVGYKRINKVTGKEVTSENIVKGVEYEKDRYVVLSEEEIRSAHPKSTQTIDIFAFVDSQQIPLQNIDTPYFLTPDKRGEKVYALLRETLVDTKKVALANVVLHTREHLAAVMPLESALVMVILRWPADVRELDTLELSDAVTDAQLNKSERDMAKRLVKDMSADWQPEQYRDTFQDKIMHLVKTKADEGEIEDVETDPAEEERKSADVIDLTDLLRRSLAGKGGASKGKASKPAAKEKPADKAAAKPKRPAARKKTSKAS
ncbi:Non--like proteinous end joining protein Ku [Pseudomonas savastanoi]|uniref:Non-homologous end joining protein Ku n=7 Tax=Pseudomonas syringae group TaxID=136849 RepID=A0A3M5ZXK4_PSESS|nr:Non--like proteinous end joining protein Ku [Pseudomonas amygdali pv. photiniae]KPY41221.1 Non--like proteinous end joining protein Ku [Pseudomonas syringae pv. rhaphiolepidis]RMV11651.1 Non--like proteinous end joining protein Ku [Pseudomonas savastanoi]